MTRLREISPTALLHLNFTFSDGLHNFIIWSWIESYSSRSNKRCFWVFVDHALANGCSSNIFLKSFSVYIGQICWVLISPCDLFRCSAALFELCYTGVFLHVSQGKVNCCCSHMLLTNTDFNTDDPKIRGLAFYCKEQKNIWNISKVNTHSLGLREEWSCGLFLTHHLSVSSDSSWYKVWAAVGSLVVFSILKVKLLNWEIFFALKSKNRRCRLCPSNFKRKTHFEEVLCKLYVAKGRFGLQRMLIISHVQYRWLWPGLGKKTICFLFTFAGHQNNSLDGRMHHSSLIICIHQRENAWTWYSGMFLWFPGSVKLSLFSTFSFGPLPFNSAR